jgi:LysR family glycine cleavage system transcriptional activator
LEQIKRLPLKALKFFFFTAKHGSLTAAAEALHVTHGAVSKQLKLLEAHLGTALWLKEGRRLRLSPAGRQLASGLRRGVCRVGRGAGAFAGRQEP